MGPAGRRGGGQGASCNTERPLQQGHVQVREPGWGPGPAAEARGSSHRRQACGPGEVGASRDGGGRAVGLQGGEASFLPEEEGRGGHPPRTETSMLEKGGDIYLRPSSPRATQAFIPPAHSPLITDPRHTCSHTTPHRRQWEKSRPAYFQSASFPASGPWLGPQDTAETLHPAHASPLDTDRPGLSGD